MLKGKVINAISEYGIWIATELPPGGGFGIFKSSGQDFLCGP